MSVHGSEPFKGWPDGDVFKEWPDGPQGYRRSIMTQGDAYNVLQRVEKATATLEKNIHAAVRVVHAARVLEQRWEKTGHKYDLFKEVGDALEAQQVEIERLRGRDMGTWKAAALKAEQRAEAAERVVEGARKVDVCHSDEDPYFISLKVYAAHKELDRALEAYDKETS